MKHWQILDSDKRRSTAPRWIALVVLLGAVQSCRSEVSDVSNITRQEGGDTFSFKGAECIKRECGGRGEESLSCFCGCPAHAPLFREDKGECVDDITECSVAPFGSGLSAQSIPYVFLPLKGQIIYPSKEISFPGVRTPICAVSGAQFLTRNGFVDLRNTLDSDVPFSLFRDEGRTFLQWTGEAELRTRMEGRLLVVHLLCRDVGATVGNPRGLHGVFTPCAAFRIAGSPTRHITNVSEVLFSPDARHSDEVTSSSLTTTEYIAIGVSSVMLGLIYVASIFLYLHIKKKRSQNETCPENPQKNAKPKKVIKKEDIQERTINNISVEEDGIIKNNPLLGYGRNFRSNEEFDTESGSCPTDADDATDSVQDAPKEVQKLQSTSVTVHPIIHGDHRRNFRRSNDINMMQIRDDSGFECLPEENVSIIETLDMRDEKPETVRAIGTPRRKLYFNPAYFEPHLLMAPPPAAIEFLVKIREVISIAKHKMSAKRFTPSLNGIPEEEACNSFENNFYQIGSQRSSMVSLKRENNRRRSHCSGCPGCEDVNMQALATYIPDPRDLGACHSCTSNNMNKQTNVRKWLEGVPAAKLSNSNEARKLGGGGLSSSLMSLPREKMEPPRKYYDFTSKSLYAEETDNFTFRKRSSSVKSEPAFKKFSMPLPTFTHDVSRRFENNKTVAKISDITPVGLRQSDKSNHRNNSLNTMPDMINEALAIDKTRRQPTSISDDEKLMKEKQEAAIKGLNSIIEKNKQPFDYETDSLERSSVNRGLSTPTDYGDASSSQASPSLSTALPMEEEMTMRNAVYKGNASSRPNSRISIKDDKPKHDYEPVEKNNNSFDNHIYNLTDLNRPRPDYSLVTEVYVNNGYNFGSTPTSPTSSDCSTFGKRKTIKGPQELPGHLTIEVKDPPENYIQIHESDGFEPDTLDRKPNKVKINIGPVFSERNLKLPGLNGIEFKPNGLFKSSNFLAHNSIIEESNSDFSSIKEIYDTKSNKMCNSPRSVDSRDYEIIENNNIDNEVGRILTLESRHCKRQRQSTPPSLKIPEKPIPPDVIPPVSIYEYPKPPIRVSSKDRQAPPLPPKNENGRSPSSRITKYNSNEPTATLKNPVSPVQEQNTKLSSGLARSPSGASVHSLPSSDYEQIDPVEDQIQNIPKPVQVLQKPTAKINFRQHQTPKAGKKFKNNLNRIGSKSGVRKSWRRSAGNQHKEDSGYLSTDSNESRRIIKKKGEARLSGSETEDSAEDARSESGAESVETHSVFFGSLRKVSLIGSVDSGTGSDLRICEEHKVDFCESKDCGNKFANPFTEVTKARINC